MNLAHIPKTSDLLGRYYTNAMIAGLLINVMKKEEPSIVLDLGAGDGALVGEAARVWTDTKFVTVDIDKKAGCAQFPKMRGSLFHHYVGDALDFKLSNALGLQLGEVDAAICNPPYLRPKWQRHFGYILEEAGLSGVFAKMVDVPADLLFLAQNLRFLKTGGKLGLILPDGIIAGERFAKFRKTLIGQHQVERVIELPRRIFKNTDAKAHILVLSKNGSAQKMISVQGVNDKGHLSQSIQISAEIAASRLDYSYLSEKKSGITSLGVTLKDVTETVFRGAYSSTEREHLHVPVFHTTDFAIGLYTVPNRFLITKRKAIGLKGRLAMAGDILLARVGRNLEEKVCMVQKGNVLVSDCIIVLRVTPELRAGVFAYLTTLQGRAALNRSAHGVGAKFITIKAILDVQYSSEISGNDTSS